MDANNLKNLKASQKTKTPFKDPKPEAQVKKEIQQFNARVNAHVRKHYGHNAEPIFIDKG